MKPQAILLSECSFSLAAMQILLVIQISIDKIYVPALLAKGKLQEL